jgi:hypothetical protein
MKKQLLTALLAFTPFLTFSNQSNKAELLAHLKQVKTDIRDIQQEIATGLEELPYGYGKKNYFFLLNMMNDIDRQLNYSLRKKLFGEYTLELLCNDMITMADLDIIMTENTTNLFETNFLSVTNNNEKEIELIKSIFIKHHTQYCQNNPNGDFVELQFTELCHPDILWPFILTSAAEWLHDLRQKVGFKIAELEKQA